VSVFVLLCRDCCCGTQRKHPAVDHDAQEQALRLAAAEVGGRLIRTRCLGVCERSNVVVVKTAHATHWFGGALCGAQTAELTEFVRGAGGGPAPQALIFHVSARRTQACYSSAPGTASDQQQAPLLLARPDKARS